jgi:bacterioferritin (cytochrome b1)
VEGTPLKLVPWLTASQIKELNYFNVTTVEQLADVADNLAPNFHGLQKFKKMASDFLKAAKDAAPLTEMRAQLEQRDEQIKALQAQMAQITKEMGAKKEK